MNLTQLFRDKMMKERLMFACRGIVTNENSIPLLTLLEQEMEDSEYSLAGRKRLFIFVLESLQNITRHGAGEQYAERSLVIYSKTGDGYTITTANVIPEPGSLYLRERLKQINSLDINEIKKIYLELLDSTEFSHKGGAGLGLLEMAKKTGNRLDYDFAPIDKMHSYFSLSKTVDSNGIGMNTGERTEEFRGNPVSQLERQMAASNVFLIWSGHISQDIGKEVLSLTETKLSENNQETRTRKRVFSILVELLDNVARYSPGKDAEEKFGMSVAFMKLQKRKYSLTTGNLIRNSDVNQLMEKIDLINRHDMAGLKQFYIRTLSQQTTDTDSTGNMGLIEMARKSGEKLDYTFERLNDEYSYFTVTVNVPEREIN
jgi:hypothetical protein